MQILNMIHWLQADLKKMIPLFNGQEPVEAVIYTQDLLRILSDQIIQVLTAKQATDNPAHSQHLVDVSTNVDYTAVQRLLSKMNGNKRRLIWTSVD